MKIMEMKVDNKSGYVELSRTNRKAQKWIGKAVMEKIFQFFEIIWKFIIQSFDTFAEIPFIKCYHNHFISHKSSDFYWRFKNRNKSRLLKGLH